MRNLLIRLLIPCLGCFLAGCQFTHTNTDQASRPEVATGTGARIMYPGESGPALSGAQPSGASGSASSSGSGPGGDDPSSRPNLTLLGGNATESSGSQQVRRMPLIGPITALFGYPFWIFGKSVEEKAKKASEEQKNPGTSSSAKTQNTTPRTPDEAQREQLRRENARIQRELLERARAAPPSTPSGSLSDELAELERLLEKRTSAQDSPEVYGAVMLPARDVVDRNADGRPDLWVYYDGRKRVREVLDEDHDGRADRILYYEGGTTLVRAEEDLDGDTRMETVSHYAGGRVVRKRTDSNGDGQSDSWSFYQAGELVRHELDRNGDGFRDLVMVYEAGQLAREQEDRNGDGRPDLLTEYRNGELSERHEDLDFDGTSDVASYYEGGKLVRRELTSEQLLEQWAGEQGS